MNRTVKFLVPAILLLLVTPPHPGDGGRGPAPDREAFTFSPGSGYHLSLLLEDYSSPDVRHCGGFEYNLARRLERTTGISLEISLGKDDPGVVDSLRNGDGAILVLPLGSIPDDGSVIHTFPLPDSTVWAVHRDSVGLLRKLSSFLTSYEESEAFRRDLERFSPGYGPHQRLENEKTYAHVSPYDSLFKVYASRIGWDWRMLCALGWKESGFRLELRSRKGASGIMQIMPKVAALYGVSDIDELLDPERSISLATTILKDIEEDYVDMAPTSEALMDITLACYNAGTGRIKELRDYCLENSLPCSTWEEMEKAIPLMNESILREETESRLGPFKGEEVRSFVREMGDLYMVFRELTISR